MRKFRLIKGSIVSITGPFGLVGKAANYKAKLNSSPDNHISHVTSQRAGYMQFYILSFLRLNHINA